MSDDDTIDEAPPYDHDAARAAALAERAESVAPVDGLDDKTAAELEAVLQEGADRLRGERRAIRVALDRALNRESARAKLASLTPEEIEAAGGAVVVADVLTGKAGAHA